MSDRRVIRVVCSPVADQLFLMRALILGLIDTGPYRFEIDTSRTDALTHLVEGGTPEVLALSIAHYPHVAHAYQLLPHGGSMGEGHGPVVVTNEPQRLHELEGRRVGVPGLLTTPSAVLRMMVPVELVVTPMTPHTRCSTRCANARSTQH
jgi:1,4-dihydroxy-6-naphthoate synthase